MSERYVSEYVLQMLKGEFMDVFSRNVVEKTDEQIAVVEFADILVRETVSKCVGNGYACEEVSLDTVCIVPTDFYHAISVGSHAMCFPYQEVIVVDQACADDLLLFGSVVIHELVHLYAPVFAYPYRRFGLIVHEEFTGLTEAITSTTQILLHVRLLNHPLFADEKKRFEEFFGVLLGVDTNPLSLAVREGDTTLFLLSIPEDGFPRCFIEDYWLKFFFLFKMSREVYSYLSRGFNVLDFSPALFIDFLHTTFFRAHFTGQLLPLARIVEQAFGEGSFRLLGGLSESEMNDFGFLSLVQHRDG